MVRGLFSIPPAAEPSENIGPGVNPSLSRFIGGRENALALYAYEKLLDRSPESLRKLNPLVFVGPSGSGKTLLAEILAEQYRKADPEARVLFLSGADYARAFAHAVDTQAVPELETRQLSPPLLIVDGLQQLTRKTSAQHFFCQVLDERVAQGKAVLVTTPRVPPALSGITSGLASRLCEGIVIPLQSPEGPTKQAMLAELCQRLEIRISEEAQQRLDYLLRTSLNAAVPSRPGSSDSTGLAEPPVRSISQIQRLVLELHHQQENRNEPLTADDVDQVLWLLQSERVPSVPRIVSAVARFCRLRVTELRGRSRKQAVAQNRALAMYLCRELTGKSYTEIGKYFDGRDHTTVLYACRQAELRMRSNPAIAHIVLEIQSSLAL